MMVRPLVLSDQVRTFMHGGRSYLHTSAVPLTYVSCSPALISLLGEFAVPRRLSDVTVKEISEADERFFSMLLRAGILKDAEAPDTVHSFRGRGNAVRTLVLFPTSSCNLRCIYCHAASGPEAGPSMSSESARIAIDDFFGGLGEEVEAVILKFHGGGEPTLNFSVMISAWEQVRSHAKQRGIRASAITITNGMFGPEVLRFLQESGWGILVSYDGPLQTVQRPDANQRDTRDQVVSNLRAFRAAGMRVKTRATLTREGLSRLRALVMDAAEIGIHQVHVEPASQVGRGGNLHDGSPDPLEFAEAFLDAFPFALRNNVQLITAAWSHTRVGNGRYCGASNGYRALTPDGFVSACTETFSQSSPDDPFIVGRLDQENRCLEIWTAREQALRERLGYNLPDCRTCYMVDTCAGGCPSRARSQGGSLLDRDAVHCAMSRRINPKFMADLADGLLLPDPGWQPFTAELNPSDSALPGVSGRMVALVPPFARARWNVDPARRPFIPVPHDAPLFFHLPE
jgi:uncharacterized protein